MRLIDHCFYCDTGSPDILLKRGPNLIGALCDCCFRFLFTSSSHDNTTFSVAERKSLQAALTAGLRMQQNRAQELGILEGNYEQ